MATQSASTAAARAKPLFRLGQKQVYLPNHIITFVRPKPKQPPNLATFVVPLTFNKFDLRDYLHNVYNVQVTAVRSFINEAAPERKNLRGPWYRPRSQKMMIVELVKPFVWPEPPAKTKEARSEFDYEMWSKGEKMREKMYETQKNQATGVVPMRDEKALPDEVRLMRKQARELLSKRSEWTGKALLDEGEGRWVEVEDEVEVPGEWRGESAEGSPLVGDKEHDVVVEDQKQIPKK